MGVRWNPVDKWSKLHSVILCPVLTLIPSVYRGKGMVVRSQDSYLKWHLLCASLGKIRTRLPALRSDLEHEGLREVISGHGQDGGPKTESVLSGLLHCNSLPFDQYPMQVEWRNKCSTFQTISTHWDLILSKPPNNHWTCLKLIVSDLS